MQNAEILERLIASDLLDTCIYFAVRRYGCFCDVEDLRQDIAVIILEYDSRKLTEIYTKGRMNAWLTEVLRRQLNSKKSIHYRLYSRWEKGRVSLNEAIRIADDGD